MDLTIGIVSQGSIYDEALLEMLDHQGVAYRVIEGTAGQAASYLLVLLSKRSEGAYALARKSCRSEADIIVVADKAIDLDGALLLLQGRVPEARDDFDMMVNKEEEKLVSLLREAFFQRHLPLARKWYWPHMSKTGCVFTHDIDFFVYSPFHKQVLKQSANPIRLLRLAYGRLIRGRDYGWNIPEMAEAEESYGYRSTFFFQTGYGDGDQEMLKQSAELLRKSSFELGLHGTRSSHNDADALRRELETFREKTGVDARGLRYHILKFEAPKTWELESSAGLAYDATFYYNRNTGFRAGVCFPYRPFSADARLPIIELPTGYMDWTALHKEQSAEEHRAYLEQTRLAVERYHGVLVANFHNTYMNGETFPVVYGVFKSLLETAKAEGYWVATAGECARWWRLRSRAEINPRLEAGEVVCSPSEVDVLVEREGREPQTMASTLLSTAQKSD